MGGARVRRASTWEKPDDRTADPSVARIGIPVPAEILAHTGARLFHMNARVGHLLGQVLGLPTDERSALAVALLDSLEGSDDSSISEAWREEIRQRRHVD